MNWITIKESKTELILHTVLSAHGKTPAEKPGVSGHWILNREECNGAPKCYEVIPEAKSQKSDAKHKDPHYTPKEDDRLQTTGIQIH